MDNVLNYFQIGLTAAGYQATESLLLFLEEVLY
jgi:hypothetical protein